MADSTDALLDIVYALTTTHQVHLAPDAVGAVREVFDQTVGQFAQQAADRAIPVHPWENDEFRAFILGQIRRIAEVIQLREGDAPATPDAFRAAATDVMRRTHRVCRAAFEHGKLTFATAAVPAGYEGYVCTTFLESQRLDVPAGPTHA